LRLGRLVVDGSYEGAGSVFIRNSNASGMAMQILGAGTAVDLIGTNGSGLSVFGGQHDIYLHGTGKLHGAISESLLVDMSSLNASIDNDTTLAAFLRAGIGGGSTGGCAGTGAYQATVIVVDTSNDRVIPGVDITIRNLDQTALLALGESDLLGTASFNLDPGSVTLLANAPGYIFSPAVTAVITGPTTISIEGYHFDPGTPSSPNLCRLYGFLYGINGLPESDATVSASLPSGAVRYNLLVVSPFTTATTTDASGYFALDLIPSDLLTPSGAKYEITITRRDGTILRQRINIPTTSSWQLDW
jgi:hypothetical protein